MPIDFFNASDGVHVRQSFDSPTVYLDHWAIRMFSDDPSSQDRFVNALMSRGGTLLLSNMSFAEFARATDARHCRDAEIFLERLLPNLFIADFSLDKMLKREQLELDNKRRFWPPADLTQLKLFAERAQNTPLGFTMHGLIAQVHIGRDELCKSMASVAKDITNSLEIVRKNPDFIRKAKKFVPSNRRPRTAIILVELTRGYTMDNASIIPDNDAIDLMHAVMSINCCDYVLLDGPWLERVEKMRRRIAKTGINMPIAKCFSQRDNGIAAFLADLESFVKPDSNSAEP